MPNSTTAENNLENNFNQNDAAGQLHREKRQSRMLKYGQKLEDFGSRLKKSGQVQDNTLKSKIMNGIGGGAKVLGKGSRIGGEVRQKLGILKKNKGGEGENGKIAGALDSAANAASKPAQMALARVLQTAWLNVIDTFGLSLIWVNIHAIMSLSMPSVFCKLGEEWFVKVPGAQTGSGTEAMAKAVQNRAGWAEWSLLIMADMIVVGIIFVFIYIIHMIVNTLLGGILGKFFEAYTWLSDTLSAKK